MAKEKRHEVTKSNPKVSPPWLTSNGLLQEAACLMKWIIFLTGQCTGGGGRQFSRRCPAPHWLQHLLKARFHW